MFILVLIFFLPFLLLSLFLVLHSSLFDVSSDDLFSIFCFQMESGQGNLGTLANVVTSLANLSDSLKENLNNGSASDSQQEEQSASDITRLEQLHSTHTVDILFHLFVPFVPYRAQDDCHLYCS